MMNNATIKTELLDRIEHADDKQIREIYGLMLNYFNENEEKGWDTLSPYHKDRITQSIKQAEAGLGVSAKDVLKQAREKYGLNG
ncbi:hypothetical protein ACFS5N_13080 [Mucilaginibacter ximonensis]|uniref:Addiction module component n=1 Tax=Mucilaginibacter ximonensis TaxID=538021 RepID=A0ABW5YDR9_9SPHI